MKTLLAAAAVLAVSNGSMATEQEGEWQTVFVPKGKEVRIVHHKAPKHCYTERKWKLKMPKDPHDPNGPDVDEFDKEANCGLTVSPNIPDPRCFEE